MSEKIKTVFRPETLAEIDAACAKTGENRSQFIRRACKFLARHEQDFLPRPADAQDVPVVTVGAKS